MKDNNIEQLISAKLTTKKFDGSYLDLAIHEMVRQHQIKILKWWAVPVMAIFSLLSFLGINATKKFEEFEAKVAILESKASGVATQLENANRVVTELQKSLRESQTGAVVLSQLVAAQASATSAATRDQAAFVTQSLNIQKNIEVSARSFSANIDEQLAKKTQDFVSTADVLSSSLKTMQNDVVKIKEIRDWQTRVLEATTFDSLVLFSKETSRPIMLPVRHGGERKLVFQTADIDDNLILRYFVDGEEKAPFYLGQADKGKWIAIDGTDGAFGFRLEQIFHVRGGNVRDFVSISIKRIEIPSQVAPKDLKGAKNVTGSHEPR